jgi:hypothetical protein
MVKNTFVIEPYSVVYYNVFIVRGIMCGDGKEAYREPEPKPRTAKEMLARKKERKRETRPMDFIKDTMR